MLLALDRGSTKTQKPSSANSKCSRCGKPNLRGKEQCPAKNTTCKKCQKRGHFQSVCRTKSVARESESNDDSTDEELDYDRFIGIIEESDTFRYPLSQVDQILGKLQ